MVWIIVVVLYLLVAAWCFWYINRESLHGLYLWQRLVVRLAQIVICFGWPVLLIWYWVRQAMRKIARAKYGESK